MFRLDMKSCGLAWRSCYLFCALVLRFQEFPVAVAFPLSQGLLAGRLRELRSLREKGHTKGEDEELDE